MDKWIPGFPLPGWEFYLKHHLREPIHCPTSGSIMSRTSHSRSSSIRGFSMVEMIGVLAIIAILAVVIVPKVFSTIASSRITNAVGSINGVKTAVAEFTGKYGTLPTTSGNSRIDDLLVTAGLLEQRFSVKIGTQPAGTPPAAAEWTRTNGVWSASGGSSQSSQTRLINVTSNTNNPSNGNNYRLDGTNNLPAGSRVVSAAIVGLTPAECRELSLRIDGEVYSEADTTTADMRGKVVYSGSGSTRTAYVYLAHQ